MIQQSLYFDNQIHRFELKVNTDENAYEKAFNLYGILLMPALLGGVLMYSVFELRQMYFTATFLLLVVVLANLYFYSERINYKTNTLKLILIQNVIQLIDNEQNYFRANIEELDIHLILCGKKLQPALCIKSEHIERIVIGLRNIKMNSPITIKNPLCQPDVWLHNQQQANLLIDLIYNKNFSMTE